MTTRRLDEFRTGSRYLADMENASNFIADVELNKYVNEGISELYDLEIDADNGKLFATSVGNLDPALGTITSATGWTLPNDFGRLVSVHVRPGGSGRPYPAFPLDPSEWASIAENPPPKAAAEYLLRKEFGAGVQELYVWPALSQNELLVQYIPARPVLSLDEDTFTGSDDELEFIEHAAAVKMLQKEESDTTAVEYAKQNLRTRILNNVKDVDLNAPRSIRMNRRRGYPHFRRRGY